MLRFVPLLAALLVPSIADASLCNLEPVRLEIPENCPLVMYKRPETTLPAIQLKRGEQLIDVQPMLRKSTYVQLEVSYSDQCGDERVSETRTEPYDLLELDLPDVRVGDAVIVSGQGQLGVISNALSWCWTEPEYLPWCNDSNKIDCEAHAEETGGCSAGGSSAGFALGLTSLVGLLWRRRCSSRRRA